MAPTDSDWIELRSDLSVTMAVSSRTEKAVQELDKKLDKHIQGSAISWFWLIPTGMLVVDFILKLLEHAKP